MSLLGNPQLPPQPQKQVMMNLLQHAPMNLTLLGTVTFLISLVLQPSGLFLNFILAVLVGFIIYQAVQKAKLYTAVENSAFPNELPEVARRLTIKPNTGDVAKQSFLGIFNLFFVIYGAFTAIHLLRQVLDSLIGTNNPGIAAVTSTGLLLVTYICFMVSGGYQRAQLKQDTGKSPSWWI